MNKFQTYFSIANVKKISFVIFLAIVLIGYDAIFNGNQSADQLNSNNDLPRVLIYGGSMINNIALALKNWSDEHSETPRFEIFSLLKLGLSSRDVYMYLPDVIKVYRADTIMLMIGLSETDQSAGRALFEEQNNVEKVEYGLKLKNLANLKSDLELNHELLKLIDEIMISRKNLYIQEMTVFLKNSTSVFLNRLDRGLITRFLLQKLDSLMTKNEEDIFFSFNLIRLANSFLDTLLAKTGSRSDDKRLLDPQYVDKVISDKESSLLGFIRKNVGTVSKNGCAGLIQKALSERERVGSYWLCQMEQLRSMRGVEYSEDFYFSVDHALIPYLSEILPLWLLASSEMRESSRFKWTLNKVVEKMGLPYEAKINESYIDEFKNNLIKIKSLTDSYGIRLVILHYPNLKQKWISDICNSLGIVEVSGKNFAHRPLTAANWSKYFLDNISGSGHMSELGARLYVESMMKQLGGGKFFEDAARESYDPAFMNP